MRTFALDRMLHAASTDEAFTLPPDFDAATYFHHSFGIFHADEEPPVIVLRTYEGLGDYYRTLPLHHSQQHTASTATYDEFRFRLHPTPDFLQEILSQGSRIEILQPGSLRQDIRHRLRASLDRYS